MTSKPATPATFATSSDLVTAQEEPLPLRALPSAAKPFPVEALGPLRDAVHAVADISNTPLAMAAQSVLAAVTLAAQALADVRHPGGQSRPLSGFFLTIARSGDGKSSCDNLALSPLTEHQRSLAGQYRTRRDEFETELKVWNKKQRDITNGKGSNKKTKEELKKELEALGPMPQAPAFPGFICSEPTFEGLCKTLHQGEPSQGIFSDEGGDFLGGHGMAKEARLRTIANLSKFWDGSDIPRVRAGEEAYLLTGKRLTLHLMIQPIVAAEMLSIPLLKGQGFLARCFVAAPPPQSRAFKQPSTESKLALQHYQQNLLKLLQYPRQLRQGSTNELAPHILELFPAQIEIWTAYQHEVERERQARGRLEDVAETAAKSAEMVLRLAGVLTIFANPDATEIASDVLQNAITLGRYYLAEALRLEGSGTISPAILSAEKLLEWAQRWNKPFTLRDALRYGPEKLRNKAAIEPVIKLLVEHGHLIPHTVGNTKSPSYSLHPTSQLSRLSQ